MRLFAGVRLTVLAACPAIARLKLRAARPALLAAYRGSARAFPAALA
ncbi:hypothetical protein [Candidatus Rariloculus sp.]